MWLKDLQPPHSICHLSCNDCSGIYGVVEASAVDWLGVSVPAVVLAAPMLLCGKLAMAVVPFWEVSMAQEVSVVPLAARAGRAGKAPVLKILKALVDVAVT